MPTVPPRHFSEGMYQDESSGVAPPAHIQVARGVTNSAGYNKYRVENKRSHVGAEDRAIRKREEPLVFLADGSPQSCAIRWRYCALLCQGSSGELAAAAKLQLLGAFTRLGDLRGIQARFEGDEPVATSLIAAERRSAKPRVGHRQIALGADAFGI